MKKSKRQIEVTQKQRQILTYIQSIVSQEGSPPAYRDIQSRLGFKSIRSVQTHLDALERKGLIQRIPHRSHAIRVNTSVNLPVMGYISAGLPVHSEELDLGTIPDVFIDKGKGSYFGLKVSGDSMIEADIYDGDVCIVRRQEWAEPGRIVVAIHNDEATVKRLLKKTESTWVLHPENSRYDDICISQDSLRISGIVEGIFRAVI